MSEDIIDNLGDSDGLEKDDLEITKVGRATLIRQAAERPKILDCVWEYVQNAYDARVQDGERTPEVTLEYIRDKAGNLKHFKISDNGHGMYLNLDDPKGDEKQNILRIIKKIGESSKKGEPLKKGENGTGSLVHLNVTQRGTGKNAGKWSVVSKNGSRPTCRLDVLNNETIDAYRGLLGEEREEEGTDVFFMNLSQRAKKELNNRERLTKYLGFEFSDWIEDEDAFIVIKDGDLEDIVEPHKFSGRRVIAEEFKIPAKKEGQKDLDVKVELYLHPKQPGKAIAIRTFAKAPVKDISKLERFDESPWNTGYISGFIKCRDLKEAKGRSLGLDLNDERIEDFFTEIEKKYKHKLIEIINQYKEDSRKSKKSAIYSKTGVAMTEVFRGKYDELVGAGTTELVEDPEGKETKGGRKRKPRGPPSGKPPKKPKDPRGPNRKKGRYKIDPRKQGLIKAVERVTKGITIHEMPHDDKDVISWYDGQAKVYINNANPIFIEYQQKDKTLLDRHIAESAISGVLQYLHDKEKPDIVFKEFYPLKKQLLEKLGLTG